MNYYIKFLLCLLIITGCKSTSYNHNQEFVFTIESLYYPFIKKIYNTELNQYSYIENYHPVRNIKIAFTKLEKDSLRKIYSKNFCHCIQVDDEDSKITYKKIHRLVYKGQVDLKKCDTITLTDDLPNKNEFKFFVKFRQIINKKIEYQLAFPHEFENH